MQRVILVVCVLLLSAAVSACGSKKKSAPPSSAKVFLISKSTAGNLGNADSGTLQGKSVSQDGRYIVFASDATNLVANDSNNRSDVFVHDRETGATTRLNLASNGAQGDDDSDAAAISADGNFIAFESLATNLVANDNNGVRDVFVHDRQTGTTTRVSVASDGTEGNGGSYSPSISADGRFVAFASLANNLVGGDMNGVADVFVHDRQTGTTMRVSVSGVGAEANRLSEFTAMSGDGRYIAFLSEADNLAGPDTNGRRDAFLHDRLGSSTVRVSVATDGTEADNGTFSVAISGDGRFVAFHSDATNLVANDTNGVADVFVYERLNQITTRVSVRSGGGEADSWSFAPSLSEDGRFVAFESFATNLVSGDTNGRFDIFVHDRNTTTTARVSLTAGGAEPNNESFYAALSADGRFVGFTSTANNLIAGDTNGGNDMFVSPNPLSP